MSGTLNSILLKILICVLRENLFMSYFYLTCLVKCVVNMKKSDGGFIPEGREFSTGIVLSTLAEG